MSLGSRLFLVVTAMVSLLALPAAALSSLPSDDGPEDLFERLRPGFFTVCKIARGSTLQFQFDVSVQKPGEPLVNPALLRDGECVDVYQASTAPGTAPEQVTVSEVVPPGFSIERIVIWTIRDGGEGGFLISSEDINDPKSPTVSGAVDDNKLGCVVVYYDVPKTPNCFIGDFVFLDENGDGMQDPADFGIPDVKLNLTRDCERRDGSTIDPNFMQMTRTDANGLYRFSNLQCGCKYIVQPDACNFDGAPGAACSDGGTPGNLAGLMNTPPNRGTTVCNDSDGDMGMALLTAEDPGYVCVDFGYKVPPVTCSLAVDEKCSVPQPAPAQDFTCTKPINELSMIWNGGQDIRVKAWKGTVGSTLVADVDGIMPGDPVTIAGFAGSPNDIIWELFAAGTSSKLGESKFHLSCSDADMNSADDCGKAEGNGKANESGLVNDWTFAGMADLAGSATGTLQCTPPEPPPATDSCQIPSGQDLQCTKRPTAISFRYTGGDCATSLQNQPSDKFSCSDGPAVGAAPVRILMGKDGGGNISLDTGVANVPVGGVVTATAANAGRSDFDSQSMAALTDSGGAVVQTLRIRTSCSKPLRLGDRFGSLEVVGFENPEQGKVQLGSEVQFSYKVTNTGSVALPTITVDDDKLSPTAVPGSPIGLGAGQSKTLTATRFVTGPQTNTVTVEATVPGTGQMCRAQDSVTITTKQPPPCEVDPGEFKLEDDKVRWKLGNGGTKVATIKSITFGWPAGFGDLKKVKFAGDIFKDATRPPTSTVLTGSAFTGDLKNRQVKPGETKELVFEFSKKFKGATQSEISITVDFAEGCSVTFVPGAGPWSCVKPIDTLSMRWNGLAPIRVKAWKGAVGSTLLDDVDNVGTSQVVTVSGYAGSPNDVIWELFAAGTSSKVGESKFHLSCSDADMNSADDCGKEQGNGKANESGLVNDWLLEGLVDAAGPLQCTP